ncbi:MAG: hypothetical protein IPK67_19820 [Planctomycetes bacterium]|nr:hypothetical protein [Planctomycetota bacterium]
MVIGEAGWATVASEFGDRASEASQARYVADLLRWAEQANVTTFVFEAFDEPWKGDPSDPLGAEKHLLGALHGRPPAQNVHAVSAPVPRRASRVFRTSRADSSVTP